TGPKDGGGPNALTLGTNGILYGTTQVRGRYFAGTVFTVGTNGVVTAPFVTFTATNGSHPSSLTLGADGNFYATTQSGGTNSAGGVSSGGTVFRLSTDGTLEDLYSFTGGIDGANPYAPLAQASDGSFYGATTEAGNGYGTLFSISAVGEFNALYSF